MLKKKVLTTSSKTSPRFKRCVDILWNTLSYLCINTDHLANKQKQIKMKIDFINSWKKGNKKDNIFDIAIRLGRFTIIELYCNPKVEHRIIVLNFGWEFTPIKKHKL